MSQLWSFEEGVAEATIRVQQDRKELLHFRRLFKIGVDKPGFCQ